MTYEYEDKAYNNEELPKEITDPADVFMYLSLRALYIQHKYRALSLEQAKQEKSKLERIYGNMKNKQKLYDFSNALYLRIDKSSINLREAIEKRESIEEMAIEFYKNVYNGILPTNLTDRLKDLKET